MTFEGQFEVDRGRGYVERLQKGSSVTIRRGAELPHDLTGKVTKRDMTEPKTGRQTYVVNVSGRFGDQDCTTTLRQTAGSPLTIVQVHKV